MVYNKQKTAMRQYERGNGKKRARKTHRTKEQDYREDEMEGG